MDQIFFTQMLTKKLEEEKRDYFIDIMKKVSYVGWVQNIFLKN